MNKRLLILGAGEMQVPVIRKANDMGLHTIVADMDANAPGMVRLGTGSCQHDG